MDTQGLGKKAITADEASVLYGINKGTLANMRSKKRGPKYYKVGRKIVYKVQDFEQWFFSNPVMTIDSLR